MLEKERQMVTDYVDHFALLAVLLDDGVVLALLVGPVVRKTDRTFLGSLLLFAKISISCSRFL